MDAEDHKHDVKLKYEAVYKEYEYIREKMRRLETEKLAIITFAFSCWLLAFGLLEKSQVSHDVTPFVLFGILSVGSALYRSNTYQYTRCFTYVEVFIESEIPWFHWETVADEFTGRTEEKRKRPVSLLRPLVGTIRTAVTFWLYLLVITTAVVSVERAIAFGETHGSWLSTLYITCLCMLFAIVTYNVTRCRSVDRNEMTRRWKELYQKHCVP